MWRLVLIFAAALVVGHASGLIPEGDEVGCTDEQDGKQCPPTCPACTCVWHSLKTAPVARVELARVEWIARAVELPHARDGQGRLAPAPALRPPIA